MSRQRLVNQVLGNMVHLHYPGVVILPGNDRRVLATTCDHYRFASDGDYGQGVVLHDFWVSVFFMYDFFFIILVYYCISYFIFCFAIMFPVAQNKQPPGAHT
jgi:hypothetical protein